MLFDDADYIVQFVVDKVDEVLAQLEAIKSTQKERQKLKPKVSRCGGIGAFNRGDQQSQPQTVTRSYDIMFQKHMTRQKRQRRRPAFGSKDKIMDAKCERNDNNTEFGVNQPTVSQRVRSVVDSTNRTASGLWVEKELFKSKNTKYSQIISTKDVDVHVNLNEKSETDTNQPINESMMRMQKSQIRDKLNKCQPKEKRINLFPPHKTLGSKKLLSRISEELDAAPVERFHKNLDFGERMFIEKFIALEISI
ncbi:uncharacterized protein LOC129567151 isoform X2 [Sitodiplosis mosellana]|uniref:uncharacterized protein LOC129567151 isoform X2 n=1 Tax=Sitodiplosis mosellana TaxID=263140 RepID=UPI002444AA49|nr:uncharacterized protein LOC129567151 isoform X2 [Sitodiplosis mosellana]